MRKSKAKYYHREIGDCGKLKDFKKIWSLINSLTCKNKKATCITEILADNNKIIDSKLIAESFNEYFVNIGPKMASEASEEFLIQDAIDYNSSPAIDTTFYFHHIDIDNVAQALMSLDPKKMYRSS